MGKKKENEYSAKKYKCLHFMQGKLSFPYLISLDLFSGYYGKKKCKILGTDLFCDLWQMMSSLSAALHVRNMKKSSQRVVNLNLKCHRIIYVM